MLSICNKKKIMIVVGRLQALKLKRTLHFLTLDKIDYHKLSKVLKPVPEKSERLTLVTSTSANLSNLGGWGGKGELCAEDNRHCQKGCKQLERT